MPDAKKKDRKEYQRQYYLKRRAELQERHRQWAKDNPGKNAAASKRWRDRKKAEKNT